MAKILFGVGVADARNKLGGHVFSKNRNGAYVRQKVSPSQPRTPAQLVVRASFGQFAAAWGAILTEAQRAAWTALASTNPVPDQFGNPQVLTGLQFYQRVNRNLFTIGQPRVDAAPGGTGVESLATASMVATGGAGTIAFTFTPTPLGASTHLVVALTPPISPGKNFVTAFLKLVEKDTAGALTSPQALGAKYIAIFGAMVVGQKIGASAFTIDDVTGAASAPIGLSTIIV
jgi:hypothetical protein